MTTLREKINALSPERKARVGGRAAELIAEEMSLRDLRKARRLTQVSLAKKLHIKQESISRLEKRSDMYISTLQNYLKAMGGKLRFTAEFQNGASVEISGLGAFEVAETAARHSKPVKRPAVKAKGRSSKAA